MQADARDVVRVLPRTVTCKSASWSPDGREIVFAGTVDRSREPNGPGIYVVRADGEELRRVARIRSRFVTRPVWSPAPTLAGEHLIVFSDTVGDNETNCDLFAVRPDGTGLRNITQTDDVKEAYPTWSPEAGRIAYVATYIRELQPSRRRCIPSWNASGLVLADRTNVTDVIGSKLAFDRKLDDVHDFSGPVWSRTQDKLAVVVRPARDRSQSDIWVIDLKTPRLARNLTSTKLDSESSVHWAPDDSHLIYFRNDEQGRPAGVCLLRATRRGRPQLLLHTADRCPEDWQRVPSASDVDVSERGTLVDTIEALPR
jgi:Tol biopolymer transport system component